MNTCPENWALVRIGEICKLVNGRAFRPHEWSETGLPIVRIQNLNRPDAPFHFFDGHVDEKHLIKSGDVLFSWSGTPSTSFGAHVWAGGDAVLNQHIYKLEYNRDFLNANFLVLAINAKLEELILGARGAAGLRHVTKSTVQDTQIVIAPLDQQERIAKRLQQLTSRLSVARQSIEHTVALIYQYRQSIIDITCNTHQIAGLAAVDLADWSLEMLGNVIDEGPANGWSPRSGPDAKGALTLKLSATSSGEFRTDPGTTKRIYTTPTQDSRYWLVHGDLLVQRANSLRYLGAAAIYEGPQHTYIYPDLMMRLRIFDSSTRAFVWRYLNSSKARRYFQTNATGTSGNMPKINRKTVLSLPIRLPSKAAMRRICDCIDHHTTIAGYIERVCQAAKIELDRVEKSLNAAALTGQLTSSSLGVEPIVHLLDRLRSYLETPMSATSTTGQVSPLPRARHLGDLLGDWPSDGMTFVEIRSRVSGRYDRIRDELFDLLTGPTPKLYQTYDPTLGAMRIKRAAS